jgi:hypothetical protein
MSDSAVRAQVAELYLCLQQTAPGEDCSPAALRQFRAEMDKSGLIDALAEAAANQIW